MESSHFYILLYISHQPFYATSSTRPLFCVVAVLMSLCLEEGNHTVQWAQKNHITTLEKATEAQKWFLKYSMVFHGIIGKYLTSYKVIGNKLLPVPLLKILDPPNPRKSNRLFSLFQPRALCDPRVVSHFFVLSSGSPRWNFIETNQFSLLAPPLSNVRQIWRANLFVWTTHPSQQPTSPKRFLHYSAHWIDWAGDLFRENILWDG